MQVVFLFQNNKMTIHNKPCSRHPSTSKKITKNRSTCLKAERLLLLSWNILKFGSASSIRKLGNKNTVANCMLQYQTSPQKKLYIFFNIGMLFAVIWTLSSSNLLKYLLLSQNILKLELYLNKQQVPFK